MHRARAVLIPGDAEGVQVASVDVLPDAAARQEHADDQCRAASRRDQVGDLFRLPTGAAYLGDASGAARSRRVPEGRGRIMAIMGSSFGCRSPGSAR